MGTSADPETLAKCAAFFVEHKQHDKAVHLYVMGGRIGEREREERRERERERERRKRKRERERKILLFFVLLSFFSIFELTFSFFIFFFSLYLK